MPLNPYTDFEPDPRAPEPTVYEREEYKEDIAELEGRRLESLKLYEPSPFQERFHSCMKKECLLQAGNQVGKSLAFFVELARAFTGQDPYNKYPKENGIALALGFDESHIGLVIHKYLFRAGAFKIIRDKETRKWRSWKPWLPDDMARESETKLAPPLIPKRFVKKFAWLKRNKNIFDSVEGHSGWMLYARSSKAAPMQGNRLDFGGIDEDMDRADWYDEIVARLTMRKGKLRWSALPHSRNDALVNLAQRAEEEADNPESSTVVIRATIFDNPYMPAESRDENIKRWKAKGEDEYRKRALGELVTDSYLMYPTFSTHVHDAMRDDETATPVQRAMVEGSGIPPRDWCRYMVVDPGHTVCAVTFWAVPPPEIGRQKVCYDELYLQRCDAAMLGVQVKPKVHGYNFQSFIIDAHGGQLREIGSGVHPMRQYSKVFEERNIASVETGHGFRMGSDDISGRVMVLRDWLGVKEDGTTTFLIHTKNCPNTCKEFSRFKKKMVQGIVSDEGNRRGSSHAVETVEYAAAHGLKYVRPVTTVVREDYAARRNRERNMRNAQRRAKVVGFAQNTISLGPQGVGS